MVTVGGNGPSGIVDTVKISNGTVSMLDGSNVSVTGDGNLISANAAGTLTVSGSENTIVAGSGNTVSITGGTGNVALASGAVFQISATIGVDIIGGGNTINAQAQSHIIVGGNGNAGVSNSINLSGGALWVTDDSRATLTGSNDFIRTGNNVSLTVNGINNVIDAGADNTIVISDGLDVLRFREDFGRETVTGFIASGANQDRVQFASDVFQNWSSLQTAITQSGADAVITTGHGDVLVLKNVAVSALTVDDFLFV